LKSKLQQGVFQPRQQIKTQQIKTQQIRTEQNRDLKKSNAQLEQENQRLNATVVELEDVITENNRRIHLLNLENDRVRLVFEQTKADYARLEQEMVLLEANYKLIHNALRKYQVQQQKQQVRPQQVRQQQVRQQQVRPVKSEKLVQELEQCHRSYDVISDKLGRKDDIINKLTDKLRANQSEIEELKHYVSDQDQNLQEVESKNYHLRMDLQRFTRLKELMSRRDQLTEKQQAQFKDILYSI
jgi:archaellum component FlaC